MLTQSVGVRPEIRGDRPEVVVEAVEFLPREINAKTGEWVVRAGSLECEIRRERPQVAHDLIDAEQE